MPFAVIDESPLIPGRNPVEIYYREYGQGTPLIFLHGGWGYEVYPFNHQINAFSDRFRILIPDRSGYGRSSRIDRQTDNFHKAAAIETIKFIDTLSLERPVLWGHSDGAVIAAIMGLALPERFSGIIMEAFHYDRSKPNSRDFFESMVHAPEKFGERICSILAEDHSENDWRKILEINGRAWLKIMEEGNRAEKDFYDGRLSKLAVPAIFIHGSRDPRTEPGELDAVSKLLPRVPIQIIENAGHSPHSSEASADECNRIAEQFLIQI